MNNNEVKCVIVIDKELPLGLIANTAAVLGCSLGKNIEDIVGHDIKDQDNFNHRGITKVPIPVLSLTKEEIKKIYRKVKENYDESITLIDFNNIAQKCNSYDDYNEKLCNADSEALNYLGICMYGNKKIINSLTGSIPMLR